MKDENISLKKEFQKKINSCIYDLKDLKSNHSMEKEDLLNVKLEDNLANCWFERTCRFFRKTEKGDYKRI